MHVDTCTHSSWTMLPWQHAHLFSYQSVVACAPDLQLPVCSKIIVASPAMRERGTERGRGKMVAVCTNTYTHACIPLVSSPDPTLL